MQRRKFLATVGSLTAASAAAMGTGAFSSTSANRELTGQIVSDKDAYLRMIPYGENSEFAYIDGESGQITLDFSDGGDNAPLNTVGKSEGLGLNSDSTTNFDGVFRIAANDNGDPMDVWIESNNEHISFYWTTKKPGVPANKANAVRLSTGGNTNVDVGVKIDLENVDRMGEVFSKSNDFTVHAEDTN